MSPTAFDFAMLAVLVASILYGAYRGMAWQIAAIASVVLSAIVATQYCDPLAPLFSEEPWNRYAAMLSLYLAVSLGVWIAFRFVAGFIDRIHLKEYDRQVGGLFGGVKGVLLCLVVTFFAVTLSESMRQMVLHSRSGYYITQLIHKGVPLVPANVREVIRGYVEEFDRRMDPNGPPIPSSPGGGLPSLPTAGLAGEIVDQGRGVAADLGQGGAVQSEPPVRQPARDAANGAGAPAEIRWSY